MKMRTGRNGTKMMTLISLTAAVLMFLLVTSCSNLMVLFPSGESSRATNGKAYLKISMSTTRAALIPSGFSLSTDTTISFALSGTYDGGSSQSLKTWTADGSTPAYTTMSADESVLVDAGDWNFTLNVLNDTAIVLTKTITQTIVAGSNTLSFGELEEPADGTGAFTVTFSYPTNLIQKVTACLFTLDGTEAAAFTTDFVGSNISVNSDGSGYDVITYAASSVPYGSYLIEFKLYYQEVGTSTYSLANTFAEYIRVATGCITSGSCKTDSVDTMYTITYVLGQNGAGESGRFTGTAAGSFNEYETVELTTDVALTGYQFAGWYTDASCTDGNEIIGWTPGDKTDRVTVYAKWTPNVYVITLSAAGADVGYTATIYEKYDNGWYLDDTCTTTVMTTSENPISVLPTKPGYTTTGYYSVQSGGTQYLTGTGLLSNYAIVNAFSADTTLYAQWSLDQLKYPFARCTDTGTIKVSWEQPAPNVTKTVTWSSGGTQVGSTTTTDNAVKISGLTNGTVYTFALAATDGVLSSTGTRTVSCKPEDLLAKIKISDTPYSKTELANVMEDKTTITGSNSYYGYYSKLPSSRTNMYYDGQFFSERNVTLTRTFVMDKYAVTQQLWTAVMAGNTDGFSTNPSAHTSTSVSGETADLLPVEYINIYDAVYFCNRLSELCGLEKVYSITISKKTKNNITQVSALSADLSKNGFRLPTDAEWEFAARGGDPAAAAWLYAFAGAEGSDLSSGSGENTNLATVAWYGGKNEYSTSGNSTHEVGLKTENLLGLYDMSGNIWEMTWDNSSKLDTGNFTDPTADVSLLKTTGNAFNRRGGCLDSPCYQCTVSTRIGRTISSLSKTTGLRLCRTTGTYPTEP